MPHLNWKLPLLIVWTSLAIAAGWRLGSSPDSGNLSSHSTQVVTSAVQSVAHTTESKTTNLITDTKTFNCPDGRLSSETVTHAAEADHTQEQTQSVAKTTQVVQITTEPARPNWGVGLDWNPSGFLAQRYLPTQADVDYRLLGDLWITGGFNWQSHSTLVGLRFYLK